MPRRCDLIKLSKKGLELQRKDQPVEVICKDGSVIPFEIVVEPTLLEWRNFFHIKVKKSFQKIFIKA